MSDVLLTNRDGVLWLVFAVMTAVLLKLGQAVLPKLHELMVAVLPYMVGILLVFVAKLMGVDASWIVALGSGSGAVALLALLNAVKPQQ